MAGKEIGRAIILNHIYVIIIDIVNLQTISSGMWTVLETILFGILLLYGAVSLLDKHIFRIVYKKNSSTSP